MIVCTVWTVAFVTDIVCMWFLRVQRGIGKTQAIEFSFEELVFRQYESPIFQLKDTICDYLKLDSKTTADVAALAVDAMLPVKRDPRPDEEPIMIS